MGQPEFAVANLRDSGVQIPENLALAIEPELVAARNQSYADWRRYQLGMLPQLIA
jgi:hypothetical protein